MPRAKVKMLVKAKPGLLEKGTRRVAKLVERCDSTENGGVKGHVLLQVIVGAGDELVLQRGWTFQHPLGHRL